jgi:hypothetical protein
LPDQEYENSLWLPEGLSGRTSSCQLPLDRVGFLPSCSTGSRVAGTDLAAALARASTCGQTVVEHPRHWDVPGLIASLDAGIAPRLLARHPATGWCRSCRTTAPCSVRQLAEAAGSVGPG